GRGAVRPAARAPPAIPRVRRVRLALRGGLARRSPRSWASRLERLGRLLEDALIVLLLGALVVLASAQILLRNVFSMGLAWSDGLVRMLVLWLALLGALAASRDGR